MILKKLLLTNPTFKLFANFREIYRKRGHEHPEKMQSVDTLFSCKRE
ncbi:hypothetical protein LEP1GSC166_4135 [Leptospira kirschneri]|nr:hypothetical protein LEP1GSC166_4135 [Leptospira kirschneri]